MLQTIDNTCFSVKLTARGKSTLDKLAELVDNSRYIEPGCFENGLELIKRDVVSPEMMEELSKGATPQARFEERCIIYHEHLKPIGDREPGGPLTDSVSELAK